MLDKIITFIYGNESLISDEGCELLQNEDSRLKLRKMIENYHKTGKWDYSILKK